MDLLVAKRQLEDLRSLLRVDDDELEYLERGDPFRMTSERLRKHLEDWIRVRDHAALIVERIFEEGVGHPLVRQFLEASAPPTEPPKVDRRLFFRSPGPTPDQWWNEWLRFRDHIRRLLDNALFRVDLDVSGAGAAGRVQALTPEADGAWPSDDALSLLRRKFAEIQVEVEASGLPENERAELRGVIAEALRILDQSDTAQAARMSLQALLGRAVSRASRTGAAQPIWKQIAGVVIFTEAALGIGAHYATLTANPTPVVLEVSCDLNPPALPPGPPPTQLPAEDELLSTNDPLTDDGPARDAATSTVPAPEADGD